MSLNIGNVVSEAVIHIESPIFGLLHPARTIPIPIEPNSSSLCHQSLDDLADRLPTLQSPVDLLDLLADGGQDDSHGEVAVLGGTHCPELEPVGGVGVGTGAVAICVLLLHGCQQVGYLLF